MSTLGITIIETIQKMSSPFLDEVMYYLSMLGDELFFMAIALFVMWCVDKRFGFKMINVYLASAAVLHFLKSVIKRKRPFDASDKVRAIKGKADSYSMPSGHAHGISNLSTQASLFFRKKWIYITGAVLTVLVCFTRLYLGQHYLTDVLVGTLCGVLFAFAFSVLFEFLKNSEEKLIFAVVPLCIIAVLVVNIWQMDVSDTIYKVLGAYPAVCIGYYIDKRYIRVKNTKVWYKNLFRVLIGGGMVGIFMVGMTFAMPEIPMLYFFLRYFLVGLMATAGAAEMFKLLKLYDEEPVDDIVLSEVIEVEAEVGQQGELRIFSILRRDNDYDPDEFIKKKKPKKDAPAPPPAVQGGASVEIEIGVEPVDGVPAEGAEPVDGAEPIDSAEPVDGAANEDAAAMRADEADGEDSAAPEEVVIEVEP